MKHLMIKLIRFYQTYISPLSTPSCRYIPTCSHYAIEAIETHGALKGGFLALNDFYAVIHGEEWAMTQSLKLVNIIIIKIQKNRRQMSFMHKKLA